MTTIYQGKSEMGPITVIARAGRYLVFAGVPGNVLIQTIEPGTKSWVNLQKFLGRNSETDYFSEYTRCHAEKLDVVDQYFRQKTTTMSPHVPGLDGINAAVFMLAMERQED